MNSYYTTTLLRHCKAKKAVWENTRQYALGKRIIMPVTSGYSINSFLPATVFNVPYLQLNGQKVKWKMEWQRNPEKDTLLQLVNENTPDSTISVSVKPLIDFASRQLNVEFPNRHSAVNDFSYYIWSLIPLAKNEFMALVSNARKIYYSGQRPGITTLYLLQYKTGNDLSIQVADSIRWPAVSELAGGLRQLPGGAIRLFLFHKEADEVAAYMNNIRLIIIINLNA
ncbi:MAG: hypothetical protein IPM85_09645 [Chitinophagaceae bacterium]|nr:hypothetical protein [Chitinophagaceae bacterium]